MLNPDNALVYGSDADAVYLAPLGTPLPATYNEPLNPAFVHVGWLDDSGIGETQSGSVTKIRGHQQGGGVVRAFGTEGGLTYAFVAYETTDLTLGLRYEERNVTFVNGVRVSEFGPGMKVKRLTAVIDFRDRGDGEAGERLAIARFDVSSTGDRTGTNSGITAIPLSGEVIGNTNKRFFKPIGIGVKTGWTVSINGAPTSGTYTLRVNGVPTAPIAYNATHTAVAAAINALAGVTGISGVTSIAGPPIGLTFPSGVDLTATYALSGGSSPEVVVA